MDRECSDAELGWTSLGGFVRVQCNGYVAVVCGYKNASWSGSRGGLRVW